MSKLSVAQDEMFGHFSRPPEHHGPLHDTDADWPAALLSRDIFQARIAHLQIPHRLSNLIWESLNTVPNIQAGTIQLHNFFFGKNLALSYQNNRKNKFNKRMWPYGQKTHTHTQVKSPPIDPCAFYRTWFFLSHSRGGLDNTTPVQWMPPRTD